MTIMEIMQNINQASWFYLTGHCYVRSMFVTHHFFCYCSVAVVVCSFVVAVVVVVAVFITIIIIIIIVIIIIITTIYLFIFLLFFNWYKLDCKFVAELCKFFQFQIKC